ncbi:exodeoxyribonuclease VII small subunit [Conchiformibius kuhniae]|uniref:Exodeoxyribonuclease 7 small subunit n=1 Tax=Conchiformibius kuhniae TaxID=211502 RepID=A0A8T9MU18_9NEIS|nr:exodeoxyribonuclease VII small subunit [Conchiformibius kuhniae]UOP04325.1 exodeoxyribonuclease VII small subunit [Conchiformibius kuhniae]
MPRKKDPTFEAALARLDTLTHILQSPDTPLADALAAYEESCRLLDFCETALHDAEQKLSVWENGRLNALVLDETGAHTND